MDCSPLGSSVHRILQARILEWVAISFSRGSSQPRDRTQVSRIAGRCFNYWATREAGVYSYVSTRASCLTHIYPFSIPSREGSPAPNLGKCKIHLSNQGYQNWSAFPTRMMLLLRTRETGKKVQSLSSRRRRWHPTPLLLPRKAHGQRSLGGCSPWGREESDTTERLHFHFSLSPIGEGNGNPLQCSCLEDPRDGAASWAAIYRVAQSRTRLKRLSSMKREGSMWSPEEERWRKSQQCDIWWT